MVVSQKYKGYVLALLTSAYLLNLLDRGLMMLLLQSIKDDLHLSDTQLGFVTGLAFSLLYATLGLPIARWADRGNRVTIISMAMVVGSVAVMACLWVGSFVQLVLARMAAAVGEAGSKPPAYSLIGDYFPGGSERAVAMTVFFVGNAMASLVSFGVGGWLNDQVGWRWTFFLMSVPALLVALLIYFTVREPRIAAARTESAEDEVPSWSQVFSTMWRQPSMRNITLGLVFLQAMGAGLGPWYAAFMIRIHGMSTTELGVWMGVIFSIAGLAGLLFGGYAATTWFKDNEKRQMQFSALTTAALTPFFAAFLFLPGKFQALAALAPVMIVFYCFLGPTYAVMQRLVPTRMRATMLAMVLLITNLVGAGIGPQIVGAMSDALSPMVGVESLRYAMLVVAFIALAAGWYFWKAGGTVQADLDKIEARQTRDSESIATVETPR